MPSLTPRHTNCITSQAKCHPFGISAYNHLNIWAISCVTHSQTSPLELEENYKPSCATASPTTTTCQQRITINNLTTNELSSCAALSFIRSWRAVWTRFSGQTRVAHGHLVWPSLSFFPASFFVWDVPVRIHKSQLHAAVLEQSQKKSFLWKKKVEKNWSTCGIGWSYVF